MSTDLITTEWGIITRLADGKEIPAAPQDNDAYRQTAKRLGYGTDTMAMCRDHEALHSRLAAFVGLPESPVMRAIVNGTEHDDNPLQQAEEEAVMAVQRFLVLARRTFGN